MANMALKKPGPPTRTEPEESIDQSTFPAAVQVQANEAIRLDATGKWVLADATIAGNARGVHIATHAAKPGASLTGIRQGVFDGLNVAALAFNAPLYLSNTPGQIGDVAGTVPVILGLVWPGWAVPLGQVADKIVKYNCPLAATLAA